MGSRLQIGAFLFLLLIGGGSLAIAQEAASSQEPAPDELGRRVERFLRDLAASPGTPGTLERTQQVFDELLDGSPLQQKSDLVDPLAEQARRLEQVYGECRDFEQVHTERIGRDVVTLTYLYKCEQFPVVWNVTFYRTPYDSTTMGDVEQWIVIALAWHTDIQSLIKHEGSR